MPYNKSEYARNIVSGETYVFVAIHTQALYFIDNFRAILTCFLCASFSDFAAHILKEVLREALLRHVE